MINEFIIQNKKDLVTYDKKIVKKIKSLAKNNKKKRARLCMHLNLKDKTNEMIIALNKKSFIAPHIHPNNKSESYFVIEGSMKVYVFSKKGLIKKIINMGTYDSGKPFFYRMSKGYYHMPISTSNWCIYHEVYSGPFKKKIDVKYPTWSPREDNPKEVEEFLKKIKLIK